jgi:glucose-6-phosphate 1-dehydrogenase
MTTPLREPFAFVIFGASGDLSRRKLIPALYHLANRGYMPANFVVAGTARTPMTDAQFREFARQTIDEHLQQEKSEPATGQDRLLPFLYYQPGDTKDAQTFHAL